MEKAAIIVKRCNPVHELTEDVVAPPPIPGLISLSSFGCVFFQMGNKLRVAKEWKPRCRRESEECDERVSGCG